MADLKQLAKDRERVNQLIKEQNALLAKQNQGSKEYESTITKIIQLEDRKRKVIQQEVALTKQVQPLYKQIESSITARAKKIQSLKTMAQDDVSYAGRLNQLSAKQLGNQTGLARLIQNRVSKEGELSKSSKAQLETLDSLAMGTNDIAGLQNEIAQSKLREGKLRGPLMKGTRDQEKSLQSILQDEIRMIELKKEQTAEQELNNEIFGKLDKLTGGLASKAKNFAEKMKDASPMEKTFLAATAALTAGGVMLAKLVSLGKEFAKTFDDIGKQFGSINLLGEELQGQLLDSNIEAIKLGGNINDVSSITSTLASNFGMSLDEASQLSSKVLDTSMALGISVDEGAQLFGVLTQTANLSADQAEKLSEGAAQLARQRGVAPAQVMRDIAGSAETVAMFTKQGGENIFDAAIAARQFGLNLDSVANAAKSSLDFESSLTAEVEASVLLGKQLNLQKAREAALNKDLVGFQKEIKNQLGGIGDFNKLNTLQQESLAKALGMNVAEVAKLANGTAEIGSGLAGQSFDDLLGEDAISNFTKLSNTLASIGATIVQSVGPALGSIAGFLTVPLEMVGKFVALLDEFGALAPMLITALGGIGAALTVMGVQAAVSGGKMLFAALASVAKAVGLMSASTLGFGTVAAVAMGAIATAGILGIMAKATGFADGGMIGRDGGTPAPTDTVPILGTPGEIILNKAQQTNVASNLATQPMMSDNSSNQVLNKLTAAVDGLVNNGVGIKGEFSNFGDAVSFSSERPLGSVSQVGVRPI